jgi:hypothetical protein
MDFSPFSKQLCLIDLPKIQRRLVFNPLASILKKKFNLWTKLAKALCILCLCFNPHKTDLVSWLVFPSSQWSWELTKNAKKATKLGQTLRASANKAVSEEVEFFLKIYQDKK